MSTQHSIGPSSFAFLPAVIGPQWYAVHTSSRHEKQVAGKLAERGIEYFLPLYEELRRWTDRRVKVQLPLFPGYLFVHMVAGQKMDVLRVPGVAELVGFNRGLVPVDPQEIAALKRGCTFGASVAPHPYLKTGCRVRVRSGVLRDTEGILVRNGQQDRLVISVDLLMQSVALEIDAADVEVVS